MFPGGVVSYDVETDLETVRVAIADALENKIKAHYSGCWLLIYACGATPAFLDFDFPGVRIPMMSATHPNRKPATD
jgi:hypothetical protein